MSAEPTVATPALERAEPVASGPRAPSRLRVSELPTAAWLTCIVAVSTAVRIAVASATSVPAIFPDEIVYTELAKGIASSGDFLVRDLPYAGWTYGPLYVLLIAPAYAIDALAEAYLVAKAIGALVMSLSAIPVYFLASRLLDRRGALLASALTLLLPAMAFSSRVMTETLSLPLFLTAVLAFVCCLERPTRARQLAVVIAIALTVLTRAFGVILVPAFVSAAALLAWCELRAAHELSVRAMARRLARYWIVWSAFAVVAVSALAAAGARGSWPVALGSRHDRLVDTIRPLEVPKWILYHVAGLDMAVGIVPFAAFLLLAGSSLFRRDDPAARPFFAASLCVAVWLIAMVGVYASKPHVPIFRERYVFYLEPLFVIALLAWLRSTRTTGTRQTTLIVLFAALAPLAMCFGSLFRHVYEAPSTAAWVWLGKTAGWGTVVLTLVAVCTGVAYALLRTRARSSLAIGVVVYLAAVSVAAGFTFRSDSLKSFRAGTGGGEPDWIDRAVGPQAHVTALWSGNEDQWARYRVIWLSEFFNRSVGPVYYRRDVPFVLSETRVELRNHELVLPNGRSLRAKYVLSDGPAIVGRPVASKREVGLVLYRVDGPVRLAGGEK